MSMAGVVLSAGALLSAGCAGTQPMDMRAAQELLDKDALKSVFSNVNVVPVQSPGVIQSELPAEIFMPDGSYTRVGNRIRLHGTFQIQKNLLCVKIDESSSQCSQVFRMRDGTYNLVNVTTGSSNHITVTPRRLGGIRNGLDA